MTDGPTVEFLPTRFTTFKVDFPKMFSLKPCPNNYEHNKKRISQIGLVVSKISRFKVNKYIISFTFT